LRAEEECFLAQREAEEPILEISKTIRVNQPTAFSMPWAKYAGIAALALLGFWGIWKMIPTEEGSASIIASIEKQMVHVQGGTFTMGCTPEQDDDCHNSEQPAHQVTLSSYYIGKYEVTQAQWKAVMGNNPSNFGDCDDCQVQQVSWDDVQQFIQKLNELTNKNYRLPTEAEWEFAARGGMKSNGYEYAGSNNVEDVAWHEGNSGSKTHPVGQKSPNELGIYDMSGNVWEWCEDWYGDYSNSSISNPKGPDSGSYRVFRGGSRYSSAGYCRVTSRGPNLPSNRSSAIGFRLAGHS
jgi:formylglycine-generating enzyme required for sulfatase activity